MIENDLGKDDVKKLVIRLAIPAMIAQLVNILYSIVDRIYVANIPVIGDTALAALGVCAPIMTLIGSFSALVGIGGATQVSIRLGEKDEKTANDILSNALVLLLIISTALTVGTLIFKKQILFAFGASENTYIHANHYFTIYVLGTLFAIVGTGLNQFILCQGYSKKAMISVIIGAVANIILDPIFIFVLNWGVAGAAFATILSQLLSCLYVLRFLLRKDIPVRLTVSPLQKSIVKMILTTGINPFIVIATDNVILIAMNIALQKHGGASRGDILLACSTILQSFMSIIHMPMVGITSGVQPILGFNYGARKVKRVEQAIMYTFVLAFGYATIMMILAQSIPHQFARIFSSNTEYISISAKAIRMYTLGLIPMSIQYTMVDAFTGIGAVRNSVVLSLARKGIFLLCVLLIPRYTDIMNIFYSESIADILGGINCTLAYFFVMKPILQRRQASKMVI